MPHFGVIADDLPTRDEAVLRSKMHFRGGMIRLERGQAIDGIAAMYDALSSALFAAAVVGEDVGRVGRLDDRDLFLKLRASGNLGASLANDFEYVSDVAERAMDLDTEGFDYDRFLKSITSLLTQLGILPIEVDELPEEESATL